MIAVDTRVEPKRGCGYLKPGGIYLVSDGPMEPCSKLPIELSVCPTCRAGVKPSRGWTWVDGDVLCKPGLHGTGHHSLLCPLAAEMGQCGLLWIGGKYYPKPEDWAREAVRMGVSRRISALPRDFELGKTLVLVAHREAIEERKPAIFHCFLPTAIEYVVKLDDDEERLEKLEKRGFTLVKVVPEEEQQSRNGSPVTRQHSLFPE